MSRDPRDREIEGEDDIEGCPELWDEEGDEDGRIEQQFWEDVEEWGED